MSLYGTEDQYVTNTVTTICAYMRDCAHTDHHTLLCEIISANYILYNHMHASPKTSWLASYTWYKRSIVVRSKSMRYIYKIRNASETDTRTASLSQIYKIYSYIYTFFYYSWFYDEYLRYLCIAVRYR